MGKRDREHREGVTAGSEDPIRHEKVTDAIIDILQKQTTDKQIGVLEESLSSGKLQNSKLKKALESSAPTEMRKGIYKLIKRGKIPTVDLLLEEYHREKSFQRLATSVGLDEIWFVKLAEDCLRERGYADKT